MNKSRQVDYRLRLAKGFLDETHQDIDLTRWRSATDNAQLAVENAAKAVLSLIGPVGRTHVPANFLRNSIIEKAWNDESLPLVERLAELTELLGFDVHMQTDYGDESEGLTPWELFDEEDALKALEIATEAFHLATLIIEANNTVESAEAEE